MAEAVLERPAIQEQVDAKDSEVIETDLTTGKYNRDNLFGETIARIVSEKRGSNIKRKGKSVTDLIQFVVARGIQNGLSYQEARYYMARVIERASGRQNRAKLDEAIRDITQPPVKSHLKPKTNLKGGEKMIEARPEVGISSVTPDKILGTSSVAIGPRTRTQDTMAIIRQWQQQRELVIGTRRANHQERHWQEGRYGETLAKQPALRVRR